MPLTFPAPSMRLRQAFQLTEQIYSSIRELQELADGEPTMEDELDQLQHSVVVLIDTLNAELAAWQALALTSGSHLHETIRLGHSPNPLLAGVLHGSIQVRAGVEMLPLTKEEVYSIDTWMPVHREQEA